MDLVFKIWTTLWRWRPFSGRAQPVASRFRHRPTIGVRQLEERIVLDADFLLDAGKLTLNAFDNTSTSVNVSEGVYDVDSLNAGAEAVYIFRLNSGVWDGATVANATAHAGDTLYVLKSALNDTLTIADTNGNSLSVVLQTLGASGGVESQVEIQANAIELNGNLTTNGKSIALDGATTVRQNVIVTTTSSNAALAAGNVTFTGPVNASSNTLSLTVNASSVSGDHGDVTFSGAVGAATNLRGLTVTGNEIQFGSNIRVGVGGVTLTSTGTTTISGTTSTITAAGAVKIVSDGTVSIGGNVSTTNGTVDITSQQGDILLNVNVGSGNQTITLQAYGDISLGQLTTTNNTANAMSISSLTGGILDGNGAADNLIVTGASAVTTLRAAQGIGNGDALEVNLSILDAENGAGQNIELTETNAITIRNLRQLTAGDIHVVAAGTITVNNGSSVAVETQGTGSIFLEASGVNSDLTLRSDIVAEAGPVTVIAGRALAMDNGVKIDAGSGQIHAQARTGATIGLLKSTRASGEAVRVVSQTGGILDANGDDLNIDANGADAVTVLSAALGIGVANRLEVRTDQLDVTNTGSGNVLITEEDSVTVTSLKQTTGGGNISLISTSGTITVDQGNTVVIQTNSTGTISLETKDAGADILLNSQIQSDRGAITLTAGHSVEMSVDGDVTSNLGAVSITATTGLLTMADGTVINAGTGAILLKADGTIQLGELRTTNGTASAVSVTSVQGAITNGLATGLNIVATSTTAQTTLRAATGIGDGSPLNVDLSRLDALNSTSGNIEIAESNALTVLNLRQSLAGDILLTADGNITVSNGTGVVVQTLGSGDITLSAQQAGAILSVQSGVESNGGNVTLTGQDSVTFGVNGDVSSQGGTISVTATDGVLTMGNGTEFRSGTGDIILEAARDLTLGLLVSSLTNGQAVRVVSQTGAILDANNTVLNIDANGTGALTTLQAATGIGALNLLEVDVDTLDVTNSTSGHIRIAEASDVTITNVVQQSGSGNIELTAVNGQILAQSSATLIGAQTGTVTLLAQGDLRLGQVRTANATAAAVSLTSQSGAITGWSSLNPHVTAAAVGAGTVLRAATGIGATGPAIQTDVTRLTVTNSTSGHIHLVERDDVAITELKQTGVSATGEITLTAGGTITILNTSPSAVQAQGAAAIELTAVGGTADLIVQGRILAGSGDILLDAGRHLEFSATGNLSTAGDADLQAGQSLVGTGLSTHVSSRNLTASATTGITQLNTLVESLSATNAGSGNIQIREADDITVTELIQQSGPGNISLTTVNGSILVDSGSLVAPVVQTNGAGTILLEANRTGGSSSSLTVLGHIQSDAGGVTLRGDQTLTIGNGVTVSSQAGPILAVAMRGAVAMQGVSWIQSGTGSISVQGNGDVTLAHLSTGNTTASALQVVSQTGAIHAGGDSGQLNINANAVGAVTTLSSATGTGSSVNPLRLNIANLIATNSGTTGDIRLLEEDGLTIQTLRQTNTSGQGGIGVATQDGSITVNNGSSTVIAVQTYGMGTLSLEANGNGSNLEVLSRVSSAAGEITLTARNDALFGDHGDLLSTSGNLSVTATDGELRMETGTLFNAGSGTIHLQASTTVTLGEVRTTNGTSSAVSVTSQTSDIRDGNGAAQNLVAANAGAVTTLRAVSGIGSGDALEVDLGRLDAENQGTGHLQIAEANAITVLNLRQIDAAGGDIILTTVNGDLTVDSPAVVTAVENLGVGQIVLQAGGTTAQLAVLDQITAAQGNVSLQAGRQITFDQNGGVTTPQDVTLQAGAGIVTTGSQRVTATNLTATAGSGIALNTAVETLSAVNGNSGDLRISELDNVTVIALKQSGGNGHISLETQNGSILVDNGQIPPADTVAIDAKGTGTVTLLARGSTSDLTLNSGVKGVNGAVTLSAGHHVQLGDHGDITTTGANGTVAVTGQAGNITMSSGTEIRSAAHVSLTATQGDVTLGLLGSTRANGQAITVTSGGAIFDGNDIALNLEANAAGAVTTLIAQNGIGVASPGPGESLLEINVNRLSVSNSATGNIRLQETDGVSIMSLTQSALNGEVELHANGLITIENTVPGSATVRTQAGNLTLQSHGATGDLSLLGGVSTQGGNLNVTANRNVSFGDDGDLNSQNGEVTVAASTGTLLMASGTVADAGTGAISLTAQGTVTLGLLISNRTDAVSPVSAVTVTSQAGAIQDANGDALNVIANQQNAVTRLRSATGIATSIGNPLETQVTILDVVNSTSGQIQILESDDVHVVNLRQTAGTGSVSLVTRDGDIVVDNGPSVAVQALSVGTVTLHAGGADSKLVVQSQVLSGSGAISLSGGNQVILSQSGDVISQSGNISLFGQGGDVEIRDGRVVRTANAIDIRAAQAVRLQGQLETTGNGSISVLAENGSVTVDQTVTPAISSSGVGTVTVTAQGDQSDLIINGQVQSESRSITLTGERNVVLQQSGDVTSQAGSISVTAQDGTVQILDGRTVSTGGNIDVLAQAGVQISGLLQTLVNGSIQVTATDGSIVVNSTSTPAIKSSGVGTVTVTAQGDQSDLIINGQVQSEFRTITLTGERNVVLQQSGDVTSQVGNISITAQDGTVQILDGRTVSTGGNIDVLAQAGIQISGALQTSVNGSIQVTATDGSIVVNNTNTPAIKSSGVGTVTVTAQGDESDLTVNGQVQSVSGNIFLSGDRNVTHSATGDISTLTGSVFVTAHAGAISMSSGAEIQSNTGLIHLDADKNITLGHLSTNSSSSVLNNAAVMVTSQTGAILDGNGAGMNITANHAASRVVLRSATGIGATDALETQIAQLNAGVTGVGSIRLQETDSLVLADVRTANGGITITAGGQLTATSVVSQTDLDANDISLTSTGAGITVQNVSAGPLNGDVSLQALGGQILGTGSGLHVTADQLQATAQSGIVLNTTINRLVAEVTSAGQIQITESNAVTLTDVQTENGSITVTAGGGIIATNVVSRTDADANDIVLTSCGAGIAVQNISAGTQSGDVTLRALGAGITRVGTATQINVTADDLDAVSVTGISLYTAINDLHAVVSGTGDILIEEQDDIRLASSDAATDAERIETANGRIQIRAGGSITIVDSDPTNDGPDRRGDEEIIAGGMAASSSTSAARVLLQAGNVDGTGIGDLIFQPHTQISAIDAAGDRGAILLVANGNFEFDSATSQITTYNGTTGGTLRTPIPTIDNLTGGNPDLVGVGKDFRGTFDVQLGSGTAGETGLEIHIDWGDIGSKRFEGPDYNNQTSANGSLEGLDGESALTLTHLYTIQDVQSATGNGRANSTDPLQVRFMVSHDPSIVIFANTLNGGTTGKQDGDLNLLTNSNSLQGPLDTIPLDPAALLGTVLTPIQSGGIMNAAQLTTVVNTLITPQQAETLESGVQTFRVPPVTPPRDLFLIRDLALPADAAPVAAIPLNPIVTAALQVVPGVTAPSSNLSFRDEYFQIKAISPDPNAEEPLAPPERLPDDILSGDRLNQLFQQLPDGQYEIDYILGEGNERSILKFDIRQGQPVVPGGEELDGGQLQLEDITEQLRNATESTAPDSAEAGEVQTDSLTSAESESGMRAPTEELSAGQTAGMNERVSGIPVSDHAMPVEVGELKQGMAAPVVISAMSLLRTLRSQRHKAPAFSQTGRLMRRLKEAGVSSESFQ